jgi:MFS transporter, BCD family, chlorophyll transporter
MTELKPLGWLSILRLGLVQSALGAIVVLTTSMLNRVMIVEYGLAATIPAALIAWHYTVQLGRPIWGHASDQGGRRTNWIVGGMGVLAMGGLLATNSVLLMDYTRVGGVLLAIIAFTMIGAGVGAAGTSLLAMLASRTAPERRPAAAAIAWILMVVGIVVTAATSGAMLDPFTPQRLANVAGGVVLGAFILTLFAVRGIEKRPALAAGAKSQADRDFREALRDTWADGKARRFSIFVFVSMLAYSMQDVILEPFAGLVFGFTPGESTQLSSFQHMGVLLGLIIGGVAGSGFFGPIKGGLTAWVAGGCLGSALALAALGSAATAGPGFPLRPTVFLLGLANGIFAVSAIAEMMELAGGAGPGKEGIRMGVWGAAQAIAFGTGGLLGAIGLDLGRALMGSTPSAFVAVFSIEGALFLVSAGLAIRVGASSRPIAARGREAVA